jgi:hypothetical protein
LRELATETGRAGVVTGRWPAPTGDSLCMRPGRCSRTWRWRSPMGRTR